MTRFELHLQRLHLLSPEVVAQAPTWWRHQLIDTLEGLCGTVEELEDLLTIAESRIEVLTSQLTQQRTAHESFLWQRQMDLDAPMGGEDMMRCEEPALDHD